MRLHPAIPGAERPVHLAGEHTSLKHAWVEGALESAVRAAIEVSGTASLPGCETSSAACARSATPPSRLGDIP
ncbi:MAG: FAD-dependent oxidoreductase [Acetobacteraceae bacterium]|nr:FAD-dependent oxidoreductase [Acetobacteraceae bacterium]